MSNEKVFVYQEEKVVPSLGLYQVQSIDGIGWGLALGLLTEDGDLYDFLTVSFGEFISIKNAAYIDTNNHREAIAWLTENGFGKATPLTKKSGFCEYPLFVFNEEMIKNTDTESYNQYSEQYVI